MSSTRSRYPGRCVRALAATAAIVALAVLLVPQEVTAYDATTCARKYCPVTCTQPHPTQPCVSGSLPPSGDCQCYNDFTISFTQVVHVSATNIDDGCGGGRTGWFIIYSTAGPEAYAWDMGGAGFGWSDDVTIAPGTYRLDPGAMSAGTYCVEYWSGPADCSASLSMASPDFGEVETGDCAGWRSATFRNDGNQVFSGISVSMTDPNFQLDLGGVPSTLDPGDDFDFEVRFCAPGGLTFDQPYAGFVRVDFTCNGAATQRQEPVSGTAHVPRAELDVASSFDVGEADWTLAPPGNQVSRSLSVSNVGDESMTVIASIVDDGGGVFDLPSGGSVGSVSGGSSRNLLVRATVYDETSYTGTLRVEADYGSGLGGSALVTLHATGHHPVPEVGYITTDIDYGEVEIEYSFHQAVKIDNAGDAPLEFEIRLEDPADADAAEFTLDLGSKTIAAGSSDLFEMTFHPTTADAREIFLLVGPTNEEPPQSYRVRLHGTGVEPIPLSTMLVVDRSGSMDGMAGDVRKIVAASDAGDLYVDLIREDWDWIGLTKYNEGNSTPVPLAAVSANRGDMLSTLGDITGELLPDGATGIGGAMETAAGEFASSPAGNAQAMIVLTDGKENRDPRIHEVKPGILASWPELRIFCVGIGDPIETGSTGIEGVETTKLQEIADDSDALFRVIQTISGEHRYDLEEFYFKAFAKATGRQLALDPLYMLPWNAGMTLVSTVDIVSCDRDADFLVISELYRVPAFETALFLQDPSGQVVNPGTTVGGVAVHVKTGDYYRLYRVKFPAPTSSGSFTGTWRLYLRIEGEVDPAELKRYASTVQVVPGYVPVAFMAAVGSDYRLEASVTPGEVLVGEPLLVTARTTEAWWPNPDAEVDVEITRPDGSTTVMSLHDDGLHDDGEAGDAVFAGRFTDTGREGYYELLVRSRGRTERGEDVTREEFLAKHVGLYPPDRPAGGECIPCWLLRLLLALFLFLLLFIAIWLIRCCRRMYVARG